MTEQKPLTGLVALVAGASRGLGAATAEALANSGAEVLLVARTQGALEEIHDKISAAGGKAVIAPVDLLDGEAQDRLAIGVAERYGRLDILVQTAAILGQLSPISHFTPELFERIIASNLTANWRLIRNFEALLQQSNSGRAIITTCGIAEKGEPFWAPYAASKSALQAMVACWAREVEHTKLRVNLIDPGVMRTGLRAEAFPGEDPSQLQLPAAVAPLIINLALPTNNSHGEIIKA
ncbi:MAG: SDR family NAD(P)-dependent oxidoreductase [Alphaproteobacteria bacterium]|jgi:NAD(P)-dependent dehydrogenase (short-subunit alcohol dehydrogenase family)